MRIKAISVTNIPELTTNLKLSLMKYNIEYEIILCEWQGFYTKIMKAYEWCKINVDYDYILFVDAHDVIFTGTMQGLVDRLKLFPEHDCIFSTERACWPDSSKSVEYPDHTSPYKYLNSGSYLFKPKKLIELVEKFPPFVGIDDQGYFTELFLNKDMNCILDYSCKIFQSVAFHREKDFSFDSRFTNNITNTFPIILHGNGKAPLDKFLHL